jgi:aminopeptidase N
MEYPTLITSLSSRLFPPGVKAPETLIVHEFIHQYFMQMVASHEQEEPWMDEGFTTYYEGRILDHYYGEKTSLIDTWGVKLGNGEYNRYEFWNSPNPKIADNSYKARDFIHGGYSEIAYNKTAMMLKTLEGILGTERFDRVMQNYFTKWKFKHPCGLDFIEVFKESLSEDLLNDLKLDLDLFFDQALYGSVECEYSVESISNSTIKSASGFVSSIDSCELMTETKVGIFENRVVLNRLGEMILPVDVVITFDNGEETTFTWDGIKRSTEFYQESNNKVAKVQLDPFRKLNLESNIINNTKMSKTSTSYRKYTSRFKVGIQHLLDFLNFIS